MGREQLIAEAVRQRLRVVTQRANDISPEKFNEPDFVSAALQQIGVGLSLGVDQWSNYPAGCLDALRHLTLRQDLETTSASASSVTDFVTAYRASKDSSERWRLLTGRYSNPLNLLLSSESECRELILERLMVQDRVRVERGKCSTQDAEEVLLKLNLIALCAGNGADLRFLDSLNYYYELLPASFQENSQHNWLLVSYWVFYARALSALLA